MGRMQDALKKAAEERERKRMSESRAAAPPPRESVDFEFKQTDEPDREAAIVTRALERQRATELATPPAAPRRPVIDERLLVHHAPSDARAEEFRKIRANLLSLDPPPRTILVTSGASNEGKSLTAANLALTLLEVGGHEVLLVDANLRYPELSGLVGAPQSPGLGEVLAGGTTVASAIVKTEIPGLSLLPAGAGGIAVAKFLRPDALKRLLDGVRDSYGFIVVDSPAACDFADAVLLSNDVDGVLVVVRVGSGRRAATVRVVEDLESSKARVLGTVVLTGS